MILTYSAILEAIFKKEILITPFIKDNLGPNSYDVTLAPEVGVYRNQILDARKENQLDIIKFETITLYPGTLYLMRTQEMTYTDKYVPMIEGKSSIGRLGIDIHKTAGVGDIGFEGSWTLEVEVVQPVKVYAGMKIGQIIFYKPEGVITKLYTGNYNKSIGIKPSNPKSLY